MSNCLYNIYAIIPKGIDMIFLDVYEWYKRPILDNLVDNELYKIYKDDGGQLELCDIDTYSVIKCGKYKSKEYAHDVLDIMTLEMYSKEPYEHVNREAYNDALKALAPIRSFVVDCNKHQC